MRVIYSLRSEPHSMETDEHEDLRQLVRQIEQQLRAWHEELQHDEALLVVITDALLNNLADDAEEITLGELGATP